MVRNIKQGSTAEHRSTDQDDSDLMVLQRRQVLVRQRWDFAAIEANAIQTAIDEAFGTERLS